jgi:hypothetical protein
VIYEIINPSDPYTLESNDFLTACLVATVLGRGAYALQSEDGSLEMPLMLFGGEGWFIKTFQSDLDVLLDRAPYAPMATCFESVVIGSFADRRAYDVAMRAIPGEEGRATFAEQWHEARRSSTNDIGAKARVLAQRMRRLAQEVAA